MHHPFTVFGALFDPQSPSDARWIPDGALVVDSQGRIAYSGPARYLPDIHRQLPVQRTNAVILPAFIDTHVHLPQLDARGMYSATLLDWLSHTIYPLEARFADDAVARDTARRFFAALAAAGTGTAMVYGSVQARATHIAFEEADRAGLRIIMGKVQMDQGVPDPLRETTEESLHSTEALILRWHRRTPLLHYAVSPRFAPVCSPALLAGCGDLAERLGTYVQTHINESYDEVNLVRELFPDRKHYTDVYDAAGLLHSRTVLGHNLHPSEKELDICEERNCAVAHCPDSNLFLGSGRFPIERYERRTIRVGLGSDVGAGTSLSMFRIMRSMSWTQQRALDPLFVLYTATLGGATALTLEHETGNLSVGRSADFVLVSPPTVLAGLPRDLPALTVGEIASLLVFRADTTDIRATYVAGRKVG